MELASTPFIEATGRRLDCNFIVQHPTLRLLVFVYRILGDVTYLAVGFIGPISMGARQNGIDRQRVGAKPLVQKQFASFEGAPSSCRIQFFAALFSREKVAGTTPSQEAS